MQEDGNTPSLTENGFLFSCVPSTDFSKSETYSISCNREEVDDLSLVLIRVNQGHLYANGNLYTTFTENDYQAARTIPLTDDFYDDTQEKAIIGLDASGLYLSYSVFLGPSDGIDNILIVYSCLNIISFTILVVMLFNALSLFIFKRSARYLLVFVFYLLLICSIYFIRITYKPPISLIPYSFIITTLTAFKYCMVACITYLLTIENHLRKRKILLLVFMMILVSLIRGLISTLSLSFTISEISRMVLVAANAVILVIACSKRVRGAWILLVGYVPFFALEFAQAITPAESSLQFCLWSYTAALEIPYAFACMLFINLRFAENYRRAEMLSEELAEMNDLLDKKVEQRTQEALAQERQRHNLMLNVFHDLRSPLFVLRGCADILKARQDGPYEERTGLIGIMSDRITFLSKLTEDIFTLAKLENDDLTTPFGKVSLSDVLSHVVEAMNITAGEKNVLLSCTIREHCVVWGNEERLEQIFQNLIANSILYTPEHGSVDVSLELSEQHYRIEVTDTGKGIKEEDQSDIFTKYYCAASSRKKGSTGLGLSIAKSLIEQHRGTIHLESTYGEGSCFTVELPKLEE